MKLPLDFWAIKRHTHNPYGFFCRLVTQNKTQNVPAHCYLVFLSVNVSNDRLIRSSKCHCKLWCVPFELGSQNFRVPSWKFQPEHSLKSDFQLGKSGDNHQPRPQNPIWLLRASASVKAVVMYCLLALLSYLCHIFIPVAKNQT